jgi:hypothetical protein
VARIVRAAQEKPPMRKLGGFFMLSNLFLQRKWLLTVVF